MPSVCAAPHLPAGILSPYRDGERGSRHRFRQSLASQEGRRRCGQLLLPATIRGGVPGRAMRGGADFNKLISNTNWALSFA
ncbi:MAG: hypothetical protein E5Y85_22195 [Mesorhizobium sp.]|nr:MAG: hypothetical protein E5Y85_22195 [Mesorhizobium sp.]